MATKAYYNGATMTFIGKVNGKPMVLIWSGLGGRLYPWSDIDTFEVLDVAREFNDGHWLTWLDVWPEDIQEALKDE